MALEIADSVQTQPSQNDLYSILMDTLEPTINKGNMLSTPSWLSDGYHTWPHATNCIAIGHFDDRGTCPVDISEGWRYPSEKGAQIRCACCESYDGTFMKMVVEGDHGEDIIEDRDTICTTGNPCSNVVLLQGCYRYLEAWIECSAPPRQSNSGERLPFSEELYEIVNSRKEPREPAGLPALSYGDVMKTLNQWQDCFEGARNGSAYTAAAIGRGIRSQDLIPAVLQDCQSWLFMRPDAWPSRHSASPPTRPVFPVEASTSSTSSGLLGNLPVELRLLIVILSPCPLAATLAVASTSKAMRATLLSWQIISTIVRNSVHSGTLRWVLPVPTLSGESDRAHAALSAWLPVGSDEDA